MIWDPYAYETQQVSIMVYPLGMDKRPLGFAPWPDEKKSKKSKKVRRKVNYEIR